MAKRRYRLRYTFWLDHNKPEEEAIADTIEILKNERSFASAVRTGIQIVADLRQHKIDSLLQFFPWVEDYFRARFSPQDSPANQEFAQLLSQQALILEKLAEQNANPAKPEPKYLNIPKSTDMELPSLFVENAEPEDPSKARENFAAGFGDLFADEDDDSLWDD